LWLHSLKVAQLLRSAACLHTNQSRSYLNHLVCVHIYIYTHTELLLFLYCVKFAIEYTDLSVLFNDSLLSFKLSYL